MKRRNSRTLNLNLGVRNQSLEIKRVTWIKIHHAYSISLFHYRVHKHENALFRRRFLHLFKHVRKTGENGTAKLKEDVTEWLTPTCLDGHTCRQDLKSLQTHLESGFVVGAHPLDTRNNLFNFFILLGRQKIRSVTLLPDVLLKAGWCSIFLLVITSLAAAVTHV